MKRLKKYLSLMLCAVFLYGAANSPLDGWPRNGQGGDIRSAAVLSETLEEPVYPPIGSQVDEFLLGSWVAWYDTGYKPYEEQAKVLADAGLNFMIFPFPYDKAGQAASANSLAGWREIDRVMIENDMKYCLSGSGITNGVSEPVFRNAMNWGKEMSRNCIGYHLLDEPGSAYFPELANWYHKYLNGDPTRAPFVNLLPSYAGPIHLGGSYEDYVQGWVNAAGAQNIEYLSHDYYAFSKQSTSTKIFADVEVMRKVAYNNGKLKTHSFPQACAWGNMRQPNADEIRWNNYLYLAYGFKAMSYFCWVVPGNNDTEGEAFYDAMIYRDGTIRRPDDYAGVVDINWDMRRIGPVLMNLDSAHAYHTQKKYDGVEYLPDNYFISPVNASDDFVISYMVAKDGTEPHVMLFNNSWTTGKSAAFNIDDYSGITGLEWLNPATGLYEAVPIVNGSVSLDFLAGEGKLLKINGDLTIAEPLVAPKINLESGAYAGPQRVVLTANDPREKIYYTIDGNFPSAQSYEYTAPFVLGEENRNASYKLRFISTMGKETSEVVSRDLLFYEAERNVALNKPAWLSKSGAPFNTEETFGEEILTDGITDSAFSFATSPGQYAFAYVDLQNSFLLNKMELTFYDNSNIADIVVQVSDDITFRQGVTTVYTNDGDNSTGYGGRDDGPFTGAVTFAPAWGRYIRVYAARGGRSVFTEIKAFNVAEGGAALDMTAGAWSAGSGSWTVSGGALTQTQSGVGGSGAYNRAITYTPERFTDVMLEGRFTMNGVTSSSAGAVGFEFAQTAGQPGLRVGVRPNGIGYVWFDYEEYTGTRAAPGWNASAAFTLTVCRAADSVFILVNGVFVFHVADRAFNFGECNVAVYSGLIPVEAREINVRNAAAPNMSYEEAVVSVEQIAGIVVEKHTLFKDVITRLPQTLRFTDSSGAMRTAPVFWECSGYDRTSTGNYLFIGILSLDAETVNIYNITAAVSVFVRYDVDYWEMDELLAFVGGLKPTDFTPESWMPVQVYYDAAVAIRNDPKNAQNAVVVGIWQLEAQVINLVSIRVSKTALADKIAELAQIDGAGYKPDGFEHLQAVLATARTVMENPLASQPDIDAALDALVKAEGILTAFGDKSALAAAVIAAETIDGAGYTARSYKKLQDAIAAAKITLAAESSDRLELDAMLTVLQSRVNGLTEKSGWEYTPPFNTGGCGKAASALGALIVLAGAVLLKKRK